MKKFLSSLLIALTVIVATAPAFADAVSCKNLLNPANIINGSLVQSNVNSTDYRVATNDLIPVTPGQQYTVSVYDANGAVNPVFTIYEIYGYNDAGGFNNNIRSTAATSAQNVAFTVPGTSVNIRFSIKRVDGATIAPADVQVQLEKGSTATSYVPYNPLCATCQGIVKNYESAVGTISVPAGTISAANPIYPTFYNQGDMVLRAVNNLEGGTVAVADSYDVSTGKITRRVGMKVFDGTENWESYVWGGTDITGFKILEPNLPTAGYNPGYCSHYIVPVNSGGINAPGAVRLMGGSGSSGRAIMILWRPEYPFATVQEFKTFLAQQYAAGTPVTVYYALETPVEETVGTTYCADTIKIATTAYNAARFNPVKTDLNSAVATIREIVTKTINQTAAIASLQADKQTRPEDACPAGKKCLLVETEENGVIVPHWFPIIEAPEE